MPNSENASLRSSSLVDSSKFFTYKLHLQGGRAINTEFRPRGLPCPWAIERMHLLLLFNPPHGSLRAAVVVLVHKIVVSIRLSNGSAHMELGSLQFRPVECFYGFRSCLTIFKGDKSKAFAARGVLRTRTRDIRAKLSDRVRGVFLCFGKELEHKNTCIYLPLYFS